MFCVTSVRRSVATVLLRNEASKIYLYSSPFSNDLPSPWKSRMPNWKYSAYEAANPYFELVRGAIGDLVEGEHSSTSSLMTSSTRFSTTLPVGSRIIQGRADLMAQFRGYCATSRFNLPTS